MASHEFSVSLLCDVIGLARSSQIVNGIIRVPNYGGIETDTYGGENSPLMALMIFTSMADYCI